MFTVFDAGRVLNRLQLDEGFSATPYQDTVGVWTIGYGTTKLYGDPVGPDTPPISPDDAKIVLKAGIFDALEDCQEIYGDTFGLLHVVHQEILLCLAYQLGRERLSGFVKMNEAIRAFDYAGWKRELRDSRLYAQTTKRVERYLEAIQTCKWPDLGGE